VRKGFAGAMLVAGSVAGSVLYRRRAARKLERVEFYGGGGSMVSLLADSDDFDRVLSLARDVLSLSG
jgi:hypothetical protein